MYRDHNIGADTGRVYVYQNIRGTLNEVTKLVGVKAYSRFGHAMVSLGDINRDGFDDVAISAPFEDNGKVFIYHSSTSQVITPTPQQVISPDRLNLISSIIVTFGTSLFSGVDVDDNGYNDLAVGSYTDQTVVILRTRPLAQISTSLTATPGIVNLMTGTMSTFSDGIQNTTFVLQLCVEYTDDGLVDTLGDTLALNLTLNAEAMRLKQGLQKRLFFNSMNRPSSIMEPTTATRGMPRCFDYTLFVANDIADILNGFVIDLQVTTAEFVQSATDGNVDPVDLSAFPVLDIVGPSHVRVEIENNCADPCIANLAVETKGNVSYIGFSSASVFVLTVGLVREMVIPLTITNEGNKAFLAQLSFTLPIQQLQFLGLNDSVVTCNPGNSNGEEILYLCDLGNPFREMAERNVEFRFAPSDSLTGTEGKISMTFNVSSLNEDNTTVADNTVTVTVAVETQANIFVDQGIVKPNQVNHAPMRHEGSINNVTQLGPNFVTTFTVGNTGPSIIPTSQLTIYWPLRMIISDLFYLYPISWRAIQSKSASVSCKNTYFNPNNYNITTDDITENTGDPGKSEGRRRRSVEPMKPQRHRRNIRLPRQDNMADVPISTETTVSCLPEDRDNVDNNHDCVAIVCSVNQLSAGNRVQVEISANIDGRQLWGVDSYIFIMSAEVETIGAGHITEGNANDNSAFAEFRSIPAIVVIRGRASSDETIPWYAIAVPILGAVILTIVVGVVLYYCGFFRRKNNSQIAEQAHENLADDSGIAM